ncbi:MAG: lytic transglycosylase domain-containing protein [Thermodesulfovibrionales bacterium]
MDQPAVAGQNPETQQSETAQPAVNEEQPVAPYASNPVAIKAVDRNISLFTDRIKERFSLWLQRSGKYLEMMKEILRAKSIPEDIAFLPLIESGFNPNAYSIARAVGPWQFIASTARRYGLKIDWWRDERRDPVKSTGAAADYLKDLYEMFGSWNLAMAAYNAGEGKILRALNRTKSDDYWVLLKTRYIKRETKEYVPRFIAAKLIAANPKDYGFDDLDYHPPFEYDEVTLDRPLDLDAAARCSETTMDVIRELNPELRRWSTPPNVPSYVLRIPAGKRDIFMKNLSMIPEDERFSVAVHTIKRGETIKSIAKKAGVPVTVILELNSNSIRPLKAGERIYLPPKDKFSLDRDDRIPIKKASFKKKYKKAVHKTANIKKDKKVVVASLSKKQAGVND